MLTLHTIQRRKNIGDCDKTRGSTARQFVPMHWCLSSIDKPVPAYANETFLLGFNEPNNKHNCNMSPLDVAVAWARIMDKFPHSLLVSPATAGNGIPWFDAFFGNCTALYGSSGCRIQYLAAHCYSCNATHTLSYLKSLHEKYHLPIWLTEFSCGDHADGKPVKDHLAFMKEVVPLLDASPFIYRYAWMAARQDARALVQTSPEGVVSLTQLGLAYNSL